MAGSVTLASYGLTPAQMSVESLASLRACDEVYCGAADRGARKVLASFGLRTRPLVPARLDRAAALRLCRRAASGRNIGVLTFGDPLFVNAAAPVLARACGELGVPLRTLHAVSSLNVLLGGLGLGSLTPAGVLLCTPASSMCLNPAVPALVFLAEGRSGHTRDLAAAISRLYPAAHPIELVSCRFRPEPLLERRAFPAGRAAAALKAADGSSTLFLPAVP